MWAFSDESERADRMLLGVLFVETQAVSGARRSLRGLLLPGQRRVHTAKESPRRRLEVLGLVARLEAESVVFVVRRPSGVRRVDARGSLLRAAAAEVMERRAVAWLLDRQDPAQAARDRQVIDRAIHAHPSPVVYDHRTSEGEPLLWAVDALVWAAGAGGEWRRRISAVVEVRAVQP